MLIAPEKICFGRWQLDAQRRTLLADGTPVALNGRAFDLLELLVARRGQAVTRDELIAHVWQDVTVGENNLTVQMSHLRKVLGDDSGMILTVPRGYKFAGEVEAPFLPPNQAGIGNGAERPQALSALSIPVPHAMPTSRFKRWGLRAATSASVLTFVLGGAALVWRPAPTAPRLSIAVLPFRNLSPDHMHDYLADELTDDLTTDLAHIPGSTVIARQSVEVLQGKIAGIQQVGIALAVRYVIEGSLRAEDGQFHVNAQLIDAFSGNHLWANRFDADKGSLSQVREAIVRRLASSLDFQLTQLEGARSMLDRPRDPDALDLFFRARAITDWDDSLPGLARAQSLLERAIAKQPDFGDALGELGALLVRKVVSMDDPDDDADMSEARKVISHALIVAPRNAQALAAEGRMLASENRCDAARSSAVEALAIDNSSVQAEIVLATCDQQEGKLEGAEVHLKAALRLAPNSPMNKTRYTNLGYIYIIEGRVRDAIDALNRATAGESFETSTENLGRLEVARILLVAATALEGDVSKSRTMLQDYSRLWPHRTIWRFASLASRANSTLPGFKRMLVALHEAGMGWVADERSIDHSVTTACTGGEFAIPPDKLVGGMLVFTNDVVRIIDGRRDSLLIDLGRGVASPQGAMWYDVETSLETPEEFTMRSVRARAGQSKDIPIIVLGAGFYGCDAYEAARQLIKSGYSGVAWYRGGEEAWADQHQLFIDRRP